MGFTNINSAELVDKGVVGLPDTPNLATLDMQKKFDEIAVDVIIPKFNNLINELAMSTAAAFIGALNSDGGSTTVQNLLSELSASIKEVSNSLDTVIEDLSITVSKAEEAHKTANRAELKIDNVVEDVNKAIVENTYMMDPTTGNYSPINEVVENLYDAMREGAITANEYAALSLTADEYATYQITARDYAYHAKEILVRTA